MPPRRPLKSPLHIALRGLDPVYQRVLAIFNALLADPLEPESIPSGNQGCVGCGSDAPGRLYCSVRCTEEATIVRYIRATLADGRAKKPDVGQAIATQLLMLSGGGYNKSARRIPQTTRDLVRARDLGRCQLCTATGTEIDHIRGSSPRPENLRLLCAACNAAEMRKRVKTLSIAEDPKAALEIMLQLEEIAARCAAATPSRPCDDPGTWNQRWRALLAERTAGDAGAR